MATLTVGPNSTFSSIEAAMLVAAPADTILLEAGYSNESAIVTHDGMTVSGGAASTGIILQLGSGIASFFLGGTAPINVYANAAGGNAITGNAGDNLVIANGGVDAVDGGLGTDRLIVDYRFATGAVTGNSTSNFTEAGGGGRSVTITDGTFEHFTVLTGGGADTLTVGHGNNVITAGNGANTITAGNGQNDITGGIDADTITAGDGGNTIDAGNGTNNITSGLGNDIIFSGTGADTIVAGGGNDSITVRGGSDSVSSGAGSDRLTVDYSALTTAVTGGVTSGNELSGYAGHLADTTVNLVDFVATETFVITTGSGADSITTGGGNDIITTGDGNDILRGFGGNDTLRGDAGNDELLGGTGADVLNGGSGFDLARYDDAMSGVVASLENGGLDGDAGGDSYVSIEGIVGSAYHDWFAGDGNGNSLSGGGGNDILRGFGGNDTLLGGEGNDDLLGGTGADVLNGGSGFDLARYDDAMSGVVASLENGGLDGDAGGDSYVSIEGIVGSEYHDWFAGDGNGNSLSGRGGNDVLRGFGGNDTLLGDDGNDDLLGGTGADVLNGGSGFDLARYDDAMSGVVASLENGGLDGDAGGDSYVSIEGIVGSEYHDWFAGDGNGNSLSGRGGNDILRGFGGNDTLLGDDGNDYLLGGTGADVLNGGSGFDLARYDDAMSGVVASLANGGSGGEATGDSYVSIEGLVGSNFADTLSGDGNANVLSGSGGNDTFLFNVALSASNVDTISDFNTGTDTMALDHNVFTALSVGLLDADAYFIGTAAQDANDRIVYNAATGATLYDADGSGAGAAIQFATLGSGLALTHNDFLIV